MDSSNPYSQHYLQIWDPSKPFSGPHSAATPQQPANPPTNPPAILTTNLANPTISALQPNSGHHQWPGSNVQSWTSMAPGPAIPASATMGQPPATPLAGQPPQAYGLSTSVGGQPPFGAQAYSGQGMAPHPSWIPPVQQLHPPGMYEPSRAPGAPQALWHSLHHWPASSLNPGPWQSYPHWPPTHLVNPLPASGDTPLSGPPPHPPLWSPQAAGIAHQQPHLPITHLAGEGWAASATQPPHVLPAHAQSLPASLPPSSDTSIPAPPPAAGAPHTQAEANPAHATIQATRPASPPSSPLISLSLDMTAPPPSANNHTGHYGPRSAPPRAHGAASPGLLCNLEQQETQRQR